jgi:ATP-dependent exoDNAse (exonuclease V) beta subunit
MEATKTATNPRGVAINFSESNHRYWTDAAESLTSVTTFIKRFFPSFDVAGHSKRVASRTGQTPEQVIAGWDAKRDAAANLGTRVHAVLEDLAMGRTPRFTPESERERLAMEQGWQMLQTLASSGFDVVGTEMIVFSENFGLAGTIDLAMREKSNGKLWILDWKTNETIDTESNYGGRASPPIEHVQDCNLDHYKLQLSTYEAILRHEKYVGDEQAIERAVIHLGGPNGPRPMPIPFLGTEVWAMFAAWEFNAMDVPF